MMRIDRKTQALMVGFLLITLGACESGGRRAASLNSDLAASDIGRNAAVVLTSSLHVQDLIRQGKLDEASRVLDSSYLYQLKLMEAFDRELSGDERYIQLRNRLVEKLQRAWLQTPPRYIDEQSAAYLERICASLPDCPRGRVKGREPIPELAQ